MVSQVVIVSNRLPISVKRENGQLVFSSSIGGLATGLASYLSYKKSSLWIGWPGIASDELTKEDKQQISEVLLKQNYVPVFLTKKQVDGFYNGYSNSILWPLFHGLSFKSKSADLENKWWHSYKSVNKLYSEVILSHINHKGQVWVHDYQLMLLPEMLKKHEQSHHIGFFLHIPFPETKTLYRLRQSKELIKGILGADLVGFHTHLYTENFKNFVVQSGIGQLSGDQILFKQRLVKVSNFPISIDYNKFASSYKLDAVRHQVRYYSKRYKKLKIITSVDRLDPSKGLIEKVTAYKDFLMHNPKYLEKVIFVMVVAPSRTEIDDYQNLSIKLQALVNNINKTYGNKSWQPIDYINESIAFESVTALFQIADIAYITPLKDGMNLAAKEFVASNKKAGVLILSSTAGASEELKEAIIVNPNDTYELSTALEQAFKMRKHELKRRLKNMRKYLSSHTIQDWAGNFIEALNQPLPKTPKITYAFNSIIQERLIKNYLMSPKRLLLLDYDGSLVPYNNDYHKSIPPKQVIKILGELSAQPNNEIVLVSGRRSSELEEWFGKLNINLIAEHGALIKYKNQSFKNVTSSNNDWQKIVLPILEKYCSLAPKSSIEVKPHSLVWHYRQTSPYFAQKYNVILKRALRPMLKKHSLELVQGNKILEIKSPKISKGLAIKKWLNNNYDFVLAIGDDTTDEDLFKVLPPKAYSIKVGKGLTSAQYRINEPSQIISLLRLLV
jgi:trehalose 6-phosphate synthase/phosphatase